MAAFSFRARYREEFGEHERERVLALRLEAASSDTPAPGGAPIHPSSGRSRYSGTASGPAA